MKNKTEHSHNQLLARFAAKDLTALAEDLHLVPLVFEQVLYEPHVKIAHAYFPVRGVLSAVTVMDDGSGIEVATIGNEGMLGLPAIIISESAQYRVIVQGAGEAWRIPVKALRARWEANPKLRLILDKYQTAFLGQVSQSVACNGRHKVLQRCSRWLLEMSDRMGSNELAMTQELLSIMLGVRRASVAEALKALADDGLIQTSRSKITLTDRGGLEIKTCECYWAIHREYARLMG
jgi:CRP-like cAMP-binding protein